MAWVRDNGKLPEGRSRVLLDNTLRIEDARAEDQGRYICKGHNEGGNVSVAVKLYVYGKHINVINIKDKETFYRKSDWRKHIISGSYLHFFLFFIILL